MKSHDNLAPTRCKAVTTRFKTSPGKWICLALIIGGGAMIAACSSPERSRSMGDARISASTIALQVCSNCHGVTGVSTSPNFPNLAAQSQPYLVEQLKSFKGHSRSDPAGFEYMWGLSAHLTEEQINGLATYYSEQKPPSGQLQDAALLKEGQAIFEQGIAANGTPACVGCHGPKAEGMQQFPRLAGQHADYIEKQLMVFQRTDERPEGVVMKVIAHSLTPENIKNVAAYLASM